MEISNWYTNPKASSDEISKRIAIARPWLVGATEVVELTQNPDALELIQGPLRGVAIGKPDKEQYMIPLQGPEIPTVVIVPLFSNEVDVNSTTKSMLATNAVQAARYTEGKPGRIYFNGETAICTKLKGLLLLHEAKHAYFFENSMHREGDELDHWYEEVATFEFEFHLLSSLCGKDYSEVLANQVAIFKRQYNDTNGTGGKLPAPKTIDTQILTVGLGPPLSEYEISLRRSILWIDTIYRLFDEIYPQTALRDKALFTKQI